MGAKKLFFSLIALIIMGTNWVPVKAASEPPKLIISQFKITSSDGQFFMIYNASDQPVDMGAVELIYFNNYSLANATSTKVISLTGTLPAHSYYLVNDGPLTLCYKMIVNSVSLGFSSTAGMVQLKRLSQTTPGGPVSSIEEDHVSWSKSSVSGVQKLPASVNQFLLRLPVDSSNNPVINSVGAGSWMTVSPSQNDPCSLTTTVANAPPAAVSTSLLLLTSAPPPVSIISVLGETTGPYMPASNIGLMAPVVNEILANPGSPKTDSDDEFVELYNPNDKSFDLSGFSLIVGTAKTYKYKFPAGTKLEPKSFTAFFSAETNLSLSNSGGQAKLLDPFGNSISTSQEYSSAKEDQAWALANNKWLITTTPTPGSANIINGGSAGSNTSSAGARRTSGAIGSNSSLEANPVSDFGDTKEAKLHPTTLAGVAALAVGYGAYEYRLDLLNRLRQFKANRAIRRAGRP